MENLERTELANQAHNAVCPDIEGRDVSGANRITDTTRHILQSIMAESPYRPDPEWDIYHRCRELEDTAMLPDGVTAQDIMDCFYRVFHHDEP